MPNFKRGSRKGGGRKGTHPATTFTLKKILLYLNEVPYANKWKIAEATGSSIYITSALLFLKRWGLIEDFGKRGHSGVWAT